MIPKLKRQVTAEEDVQKINLSNIPGVVINAPERTDLEKLKIIDPRERQVVTEKWSDEKVFEALAASTPKNQNYFSITTDVLVNAPVDFFTKYQVAAQNIEKGLRVLMSEGSNAKVAARIKEATANPTNRENLADVRADIFRLFNIYRQKNASSIRKDLGQSNNRLQDSRYDKLLLALVLNSFIGLGPLEPLWADKEVTEIMANGPWDIEIERKGVVEKVDSCNFLTAKDLFDLIKRLYASINKQISQSEPLMKGRLPDKSRIYAVHQVVAPDGPNFNIRKHPDRYISPEAYVEEFGAADKEIMGWIGNMIYNDASILVVGGTSTGKTTLLNSLTGYIRPDKRCISIEDNLELKPHPNKLFAAAMECVQANSSSESSRGTVTMRDLVKASMQMRPEGIIVGEVTDEAAYDLTQAANTGHTAMSTYHANSADDAMFRLMSLVTQAGEVKEEQAYGLIAAAFDVIIIVSRFPIDGSRKITSVSEISSEISLDKSGTKVLKTKPIWQFVPDKERTGELQKVAGTWKKVSELSPERREKLYLDIKPSLTFDELREISKITPTKKSIEGEFK